MRRAGAIGNTGRNTLIAASVMLAGCAVGHASEVWRASPVEGLGAPLFSPADFVTLIGVGPVVVGEQPRLWGQSVRFSSSGAFEVAATWTRAGGATPGAPAERIGLFDAIHTSASGRQVSDAGALLAEPPNAAGQLIGRSTRFLGEQVVGSSAWLWTPEAGTRQIGPVGGLFESELGFAESFPVRLNGLGQVLGLAARFDVTGMLDDQTSRLAWVWSPVGGTELVGIFDAAHRRSDGYEFHEAAALSEQGTIAGNSTRFSQFDFALGRTGWFKRPNQPLTRIEFTGPEWTNAQGEFDFAVLPNGRGNEVVLGLATRYAEDDTPGVQAYAVLPDATTPTLLGIFDAQHRSQLDLQKHFVLGVLENPIRVVGASVRFFPQPDGREVEGSTGWLWTPAGGFVRAGLTDAEHTSAITGRQSSLLSAAGPDGIAYGFSERFDSAGEPLGSTFIAIGPGAQATRRVGLFDALHLSSEGQYRVELRQVGEDGRAYGVSYRYNGRSIFDPLAGRTAWVFDPRTDSLTTLVFSQTSTGDAVTDIAGVTASGLVFGDYVRYVNDIAVERRAYIWSAQTGKIDVNDLVEGGVVGAGLAGVRVVDQWDDQRGFAVVFAELAAAPGDFRPFILRRIGAVCDTLDFNRDGDFPTPLDVEDFINAVAGNLCATCSTDIDFNNDGDFPTPLDVEVFIQVNAGGACQ